MGDRGGVAGLCGVAAGAVQRRNADRRRPFALQRPAQSRRRPARSPDSRSCSTRSAARPARCRICSRSTRSWRLWVCVFALAVGALMVSRIPYPHVVNQIFRGQRSFGHIVGVVFALVAIVVSPRLFDSDDLLGVRARSAAEVFLAAIAAAQHRKRAAVLIVAGTLRVPSAEDNHRLECAAAQSCGTRSVPTTMFTGLVETPGNRRRFAAGTAGRATVDFRWHRRGGRRRSATASRSTAAA